MKIEYMCNMRLAVWVQLDMSLNAVVRKAMFRIFSLS